MSLIYISDTNIWIDFRNAGLLEHMFRLPFTLCCTDFVMHELEDFPHDELLARGLVVESFDEGGVQKLLTLTAPWLTFPATCSHKQPEDRYSLEMEAPSPGNSGRTASAWCALVTRPHGRISSHQ